MNNYTVYMHVFPDGKKYIGITRRYYKYRWCNGSGYKSQKRFYEEIKTVGWDNMQHIILYSNLSQEEAYQKEKELISKYKSNNPEYGFNIENGGTEFCVSDATKKKISDTMKKIYKNNPNTFKKGNKPWIVGKHHSEETKVKIKEKRAKQILETNKVLCIETGEIFDSAKNIEDKYGFSAKCIRRVCSGERNSYNGLHWKYINPKNRKNKKYY